MCHNLLRLKHRDLIFLALVIAFKDENHFLIDKRIISGKTPPLLCLKTSKLNVKKLTCVRY